MSLSCINMENEQTRNFTRVSHYSHVEEQTLNEASEIWSPSLYTIDTLAFLPVFLNQFDAVPSD